MNGSVLGFWKKRLPRCAESSAAEPALLGLMTASNPAGRRNRIGSTLEGVASPTDSMSPPVLGPAVGNFALAALRAGLAIGVLHSKFASQ